MNGVQIIKEIACNWQDILCIYPKSQEFHYFWPNLTDLKTIGVDPCLKKTSVLINFFEKPDIDLLSMRDWLHANCQKRFRTYNKFNYTYSDIMYHHVRRLNSSPYITERKFIGTNFRFENIHDASLFKLFWY